MPLARRGGAAWPLVVGTAIAALWPLSAYAVDPLLLPGCLAVGGVTALVIWRAEYGIAVALAVAPFLDKPVRAGTYVLTPLEILLPALAVALAAYAIVFGRGHSMRGWAARWTVAGALAFLGTAVFSSLQALEPSRSLNKLIILVAGVAILFAVLQLCTERRQLLVVAAGALAGLVLASVEGIWQAVASTGGLTGFETNSGDVVERVQGSFEHPNQFGGYLSLLLPLAAALSVTRATPPKLRTLAITALALGLPALLLSYTRGAIAGLVVGSLLWLAFVRPRAAAGLAVVVLVGGFAMAPSLVRERLDLEGHEGEVTLRADIWNAALEIYSDHPVAGVGLNNFAVAYERLPSNVGTGSQRRLLHGGNLTTPLYAQNLYLNVLAEQGTIGLVALGVFLIAAFASAFAGSRTGDPVLRAVAVAVGAGLMALAVHNLVDVTLFQGTAVPLFALVGLAAVIATRKDVARRSPGQARK